MADAGGDALANIPLVAGFLVLALSGAALAIGAGHEAVGALISGLLLQRPGGGDDQHRRADGRRSGSLR